MSNDRPVRYVYVSIGNSDDVLTQQAWSNFCLDVSSLLFRYATARHGEWFSSPQSPWQNACWCVEIPEDHVDLVRSVLAGHAGTYRQRAIAWSEATYGEVTPENPSSHE